MNTFSINRQFSLALEALSELRPELDGHHSNIQSKFASNLVPVLSIPSLESVLNEIGSMPREALFIGIATDGFPVLLNLHDPTPGPILIMGDPDAGKTSFLQNIANGIGRMHEPADVQFGVITAHSELWEDISALPHCAGIFSVYHSSAMDFLYSLSGWAHENKGTRQSVLLLLDDLENMENVDFDVCQTLRWLLIRGPSRRVWPVVTVNAERILKVSSWLGAFRTKIVGHVERCHPSLAVKKDEAIFRSLKSGLQFAICEGDGWMRFWIPA